jgi:hypothetical protein
MTIAQVCVFSFDEQQLSLYKSVKSVGNRHQERAAGVVRLVPVAID